MRPIMSARLLFFFKKHWAVDLWGGFDDQNLV